MGIRKAKPAANSQHSQEQGEYRHIAQINGTHPLQDEVPFSHMSYAARQRRDGKVVFFNFGLAKEMGLIPKSHPHQFNATLKKTLIESFSQIIINEYDILNEVKIPKRDIKEHRYMATRYLQLQHADRRGLSSGDGRSIWNGVVKTQGKTWDITSCGTGATCLSPASATQKKFFQSGDPDVSYGCGYASVEEGFTDALFSESLCINGVATERVLCIISFGDSYGVKVRAGQNLLRPSHFFLHLKQNQVERLRAMTDYYIDRQIANGSWAPVPKGENKYDYFLGKISETFAKISAQFESEYIFCWMDWDGDNILADGGIIDFGSIRQFGLFHHEYRFDDDDRWSTNIKEQKLKARHIVQSFTQMVNYIKTGKKKNHRLFFNSRSLKNFDKTFARHKQFLLLQKIGYTAEEAIFLQEQSSKTVRKYEEAFYYFERQKSKRGEVKVPDGISWNAVFCMRDILREFPRLLSENKQKSLSASEFIQIIKSEYATRKDLKTSRCRTIRAIGFQEAYVKMIEDVARFQKETFERKIRQISKRAAVINRYERITGDGISTVGEILVGKMDELSTTDIQQFMEKFVARQNLNPDLRQHLELAHSNKKTKVGELLEEAQEAIKNCRAGL